ncbi:pancreatic triacylglycerol lipase-like [Ostrea edulis]|uniref:pancreatic triacylglycerol lipase-like n=1 Tax=Ostrea edulis TaxID=37623 RepID=UPI0024AEF057|nr:pancreatic triacylglycerol lipase-like [Ostrea edulis]
MGAHSSHGYNCHHGAMCTGIGKRGDETSVSSGMNNNEAMVRATNLCFAILAVKMCMSKRFNKRPESPEEMKLKNVWFEGVDKISENTALPESFDRSKETDVIIHGYLVDTSLPEIRDLAATLSQRKHNVLLIDWALGAGVNYAQSASNVQTVGAYVYRFLEKNKIPWNKVHILGQGLGAHAAGEAGRLSKGKIGRITGLDPASPLFETSKFAINKESAQFVDIIHTDARPFGYGMKKACGHLDIYVNGGRRQPGCTYNPKKPVRIHALKKATFHKACGHLKAVGYYVESISDKCKFRACECTYKRFLASKCSPNKCVFWGYDAKKGSEGMYYGVTATAYPYCRTNGSE